MHPKYVLGGSASAGTLAMLIGAWWLGRSSPQEPTPAHTRSIEASPRKAEQNANRGPEGQVDACHDEQLTAQNVPIVRVPGAPQPVRGGSLQDGVYDVASYHVFGKPPERALPGTFRQTIVVEQNGTITKNVRIGRRGDVETTTWAAAIRGSELELTGVCPPAVKGSTETVSFEAEGQDLVMSFEQAGVPVQVTYRRQAG